MGKANRKKIDLIDSNIMVGLIQTLKDIADSKLFDLINDKGKFRRFGETFVDFFRLLSLTQVKHPLIANDNPAVGIVVVTVEGSFLGKFNNGILRRAQEEKAKYEQFQFIGVGEKSIEPLSVDTPKLKSFVGMEAVGLYETAVALKTYLVDEIMSGRLGKVLIVYSWPKTIDTQKIKVFPLLPCKELVSKQSQFVDEFETVIQESDSEDVIGMLTNLWVTTRIYEVFIDSLIASAAAQAAFLDESVDRMKKELVKVRMIYRKARKSDIDNSLRETFSARLMTEKLKAAGA